MSEESITRSQSITKVADATYISSRLFEIVIENKRYVNLDIFNYIIIL